MHVYIKILPNSSDDWSGSGSPFSNYNLAGGKTAFVLGTVTSSSLTSSVRVPGMLTALGKINKSVNIFSESRTLDNTFKGIGGVAQTSDFSFSLENITGNAHADRLLGRTLLVVIGYTNDMKELDGTNNRLIFTGKIFDVDNAKRVLDFTVRGRFSLWDKQIGEILPTNTNTTYKGKIVPITYGDWTDDAGFMPVILDKNVENTPALRLGKRKNGVIDAFYAWDEGSKEAYLATNGTDVTINADRTEILLSKESDSYLTEAMNAIQTFLKLWNPPTFIIEVTDSLPYVEEPVGHTKLATGSVYTDGTYSYEFVESVDEYYVFTVINTAFLPPSSGALSNVSGDGPATINYSWRSRKHAPEIEVENTEEIDRRISGFKTVVATSSLRAAKLSLLVEEEEVQVYLASSFAVANLYAFHRCYLFRENGVSHSINTDIVVVGEGKEQSKWLVKHLFSVQNFANIQTPELGDWWAGGVSVQSHERLGLFTFEDMQYAIKEGSAGGDQCTVIDTTVESPDKVNSLSRARFLLFMDMLFKTTSVAGEIANIYFKGFALCTMVGGYGDAALCLGLGGKWVPGVMHLGPEGQDPDLISGDIVGTGIHPEDSLGRLGHGRLIVSERDGEIKSYRDDVFNIAWRKIPDDTSGTPNGVTLYFNNAGKTFLTTYTSKNTDTAFDLRGRDLEVGNQGEYPDTTCISMVRFDTNALVGTLTDFNAARYFLCFSGFTSGAYDELAEDANFKLYLANLGFLIYFYVDPLKTPFWVRGTGRVIADWHEAYFNGTAGDLITNPVGVIEDLARTELGMLSAELDETSFDAAYTARASWKGALTVYEDPVSFYDLLNRIARQFGLVIAESSDGKLTVDSLDIPTTGTREITSTEVLRDSTGSARWSESYTGLTSLFTEMEVKYRKNEADNSFADTFLASTLPEGLLLADAADILDEDRKVQMEYDCIRDEITVEAATALAVKYSYKNTRIIKAWVSLTCLDLRIGQWLTIASGSKIRGVANNVYLVVGIDFQPPYRGVEPELSITLVEKRNVTVDNTIVCVYDDEKIIDSVYDGDIIQGVM